ncbi:MAG: phospholipase D-like domain-containing protein [Chloroflexota bacterium]|nr:phospholipase D-like domain-containing protein [Chloroflexota bacterium]
MTSQDSATAPPPDQPRPPSSRPRLTRWTWLVAAVLAILAALAVLIVFRGIERRTPHISRSDERPAASGAAVAGIFIEPEDGRAPILEELDTARASISLIVYLLSDEETIMALESAAARGIAVRVILEEHPFGGAGGQPELFGRLQAAGIEVRWGDPVFRFTHIKTAIVDDRVAIIMNQNLTYSAFTSNRELGVITTRPEDVAAAVAIFEADWHRTGEVDAGPLIVSPANSRGELLALINRARATLDIYAEVVRDEELLGAIVAAVERGVAVRLVMSGDPGDHNAEDRTWLAAAGVQVRLLSEVYIHAKMFLVDGSELFVGSQNMTATSLDQNRELGLILTESGSIERAAKVFDRDFAAARSEAP